MVRRSKSNPPASPPPKGEPPPADDKLPPGLKGDVGAGRLDRAVEKAKAGLDDEHKKAGAKGKRGRPTKASQEALELDLSLCKYIVRLPFSLAGTLAAALTPPMPVADGRTLRDDVVALWQFPEAEADMAGKALHTIALRSEWEWVKFLPWVVLVGVVGGGMGTRGALSARIIKGGREAAKRASTAPGGVDGA